MSVALEVRNEPSSSRLSRATVAGVGILLLVKLWLLSNRAVTAIGPAGHDDHLYLNMAKSLAGGHWMGTYNQMTLAKGQFYSMWIAAMFGLGIPLFFAQHLLYAAACATLVAAIAPALRSALAQVVLFAVLLFNPATFANGVGTRVIREGIYPALTLFVLGCALAIVLRVHQRFRSNIGWAVGLGLSLAALWLCREERVWIVPALVVAVIWSLVQRPPRRRAVLLLGATAAAVFILLVGGVVAKNWRHYGVPVITEFTEGEFPGAYAALGRVRHAAERPRIPLPQETRLRIYAVSPRFAELRPFMEGDLGRAWSMPGCNEAGICGDIAAGWLMWALRDAAALAGHYRDARETARFWVGVRDEVAAACRDGRLECGGLSSGFMPPLRRAHAAAFVPTLLHAGVFLATLKNLEAHPGPSMGPDFTLQDFRDLTRERLMDFQPGAEPAVPLQGKLAAWQERVLDRILALYRRLVPPCGCAALAALAVAGVVAIRRRTPSPLLLTACLFLVATASRLGILTLVHVTTFPALSTAYLSPAYALFLAFVVIALASSVELARTGQRLKAPLTPPAQQTAGRGDTARTP